MAVKKLEAPKKIETKKSESSNKKSSVDLFEKLRTDGQKEKLGNDDKPKRDLFETLGGGDKRVVGTDKEVRVVPGAPDKISLQLENWLRKQQRNNRIFDTAGEIFKKVDVTINERENLLEVRPLAHMTNGLDTSDQIRAAATQENKLAKFLGDLRQERDNMLGEAKNLAAMPPPIENLYGFQTELNKVTDIGLKEGYQDMAKTYSKAWEASKIKWETSLNDAISSIVKTEKYIDKALEALVWTKENHRQLEEKLATEQQKPTTKREEQKSVDKELELVDWMIKSRGDTFRDAKEKFNRVDMTLRREKSVLNEYREATMRNGEIKGQITSGDGRDATLRYHRDLLKFNRDELNFARNNAIQQINKLFAMDSPIEDFYKLRSEINKETSPDLKEEYLGWANKQRAVWEKYFPYKEDYLTKGVSRLKILNERIEATKEALHETEAALAAPVPARL